MYHSASTPTIAASLPPILIPTGANLPFTPHSAVATIEGTEPPSFVRVFTPRSGVSFALCPSGGQVEVFTNDADGTIAGHAFYIVFN